MVLNRIEGCLTAPFFNGRLSMNDSYKICLECEKFRKITKTCKVCNCFMPVKTMMPGAQCPDNPPKWVNEHYGP